MKHNSILKVLFKPGVFFFLSILLDCNELYSQNQDKELYVLDMVHHNPGEMLTVSAYNNPAYLEKQGYTGQVMNDFTFVHAAITYDSLDKRIFPEGSKERDWVLKAAERVKTNIKKAHDAGIKVYYFTDIIVLPKKLVELYKDEICDSDGKISLGKSKTLEIHRLMLQEVFKTFPDLDGLVIRTGETYLNNVPYHTGNNPILKGVESHIKLINLLREEVCVKQNKKVFYRTWSFGGMHDSRQYYLDVTNKIEPHKNLVFAIKHTQGDYHRTHDFNPTISVGKHEQVIEVQCQREYEGKGAFPNYIAEGVINGFEEYQTNTPQIGYKSLQDIKNTSQFKGVWTWSRGGGWVGPYISNEFWIKLNAYVLGHWAQNPNLTEEEVFNQFMKKEGIKGKSAKAFRVLNLLSAKAVIRGHSSVSLPFEKGWVWWTRDHFLDGTNPDAASPSTLQKAFVKLHQQGLLDSAVKEKFEAVVLWEQIDKLSKQVKMHNKADRNYIKVSSRYGLLLHKIIAEGWNIMAMGFTGDLTGSYDKQKIEESIKRYDKYWEDYKNLKENNPDCATLYKPYAFVYQPPHYQSEVGMASSINKYRNIK